MNFNGLDNLDIYFGATALGILLVTFLIILRGLKHRSIGYKTVVVLISLGLLVPGYFCFQHQINFPIIGTLFILESFVGFVVVFRTRN